MRQKISFQGDEGSKLNIQLLGLLQRLFDVKVSSEAESEDWNDTIGQLSVVGQATVISEKTYRLLHEQNSMTFRFGDLFEGHINLRRPVKDHVLFCWSAPADDGGWVFVCRNLDSSESDELCKLVRTGLSSG